MDSEYLKKHVSFCLTEALTEVVERRPLDPIEFIAHFLYKFKENESHDAKVIYWYMHKFIGLPFGNLFYFLLNKNLCNVTL